MKTLSVTPNQWIDTADVAKLLRAELKKRWPTVTFSVRSERYSGGSSILVKYTDGPAETEVTAVAGNYAGQSFDGMIDMQYCNRHVLMPDGTLRYHGTGGTVGSAGVVPADDRPLPPGATPVKCGNGYVSVSRSYSKEALAPVAEEVARYWGKETPEIRTWSDGSNAYVHTYDAHLQDALWRALRERDL